MAREIVFDTETTGKRYQEGHRIVEIAAIEMIDGVPTGNVFHTLINPERNIPDEVVAIHGITNAKVANAPKFKEIIPDLVAFFQGATTIAHNSEFDEKFINHELQLAEYPDSFWSIVENTVDTIEMSRKIWRESKKPQEKDKKAPKVATTKIKHSLDAVLDRCGIDRTARELHGALLDSELLAKAYVAMKQMIIEMGPTLEDDMPRPPIKRINVRGDLPKVVLNDNDIQANDVFLKSINPEVSVSFARTPRS